MYRSISLNLHFMAGDYHSSFDHEDLFSKPLATNPPYLHRVFLRFPSGMNSLDWTKKTFEVLTKLLIAWKARMSLYSPVGPGGKRTFQNIFTQSTPFRWIIINNYAHCGNVLSPVDPTLKLDEIWSVCLHCQVHGGLGFVDHNRKPDVTIMVMIVIALLQMLHTCTWPGQECHRELWPRRGSEKTWTSSRGCSQPGASQGCQCWSSWWTWGWWWWWSLYLYYI